MKFVGRAINKQWLQNVLADAMEDCVRVRAAVAYANQDNVLLFEACQRAGKPLAWTARNAAAARPQGRSIRQATVHYPHILR